MNWDIQNLFVRHAQELNRFLRRRRHSADVAADLTQETFLRLLSSRSTTRPANARAYIYQIARNLSLDFYRHEDRTRQETLPEDVFHAIADPAPGAEQSVIDRQRLRTVERAIDALPERTRRAFELYQMENATISDVARELDLSISRTWQLIRRAYAALREALEEYDRT